MNTPLLTIDQASKQLQVSQQTLRRMIKRGDIVAIRVGGQLRFSQEVLDSLPTVGHATDVAPCESEHANVKPITAPPDS